MPAWRQFRRKNDFRKLFESISAGYAASSAGYSGAGYSDPDLKAETKAAYTALARYAAALTPGAVDEGSADTLDGVIDTWADRWLARVDQQNLRAKAALERRLGAYTQREVEQALLLEGDEFQMNLARQALQEASEQLLKVDD